MGHQGIAINDMCEEDKIEGLQVTQFKELKYNWKRKNIERK